ncbi:hypothetical protein HMPREF0880_03459 [Yokenella regensburgei ATCC 43003]|nr:hypothetical protein HMPREF0880_03459 [Yokenella regensburgei ATCC 43003]
MKRSILLLSKSVGGGVLAGPAENCRRVSAGPGLLRARRRAPLTRSPGIRAPEK